MAKGVFDERELPVTCPGCGHKHVKTVRWLRDHQEITCAGCGKRIEIDNAQMREGFDKVDGAMDRLRKSFSRLGKKR